MYWQLIIICKFILMMVKITHQYSSLDSAISDIYMYFNLMNNLQNLSNFQILNTAKHASTRTTSEPPFSDEIRLKIKLLCDNYDKFFTIDPDQKDIGIIWKSLFHNIPFSLKFKLLIDNVGSYIKRIDDIYNERFLQYIKSPKSLQDLSLINSLIESIILNDKDDILARNLERIYNNLIFIDENSGKFFLQSDKRSTRFFEQIDKNPEFFFERLDQMTNNSFDISCLTHMSVQQHFYQIYKIFIVTEIRQFIMIHFSHIYNRAIVKNGSHNEEITIASVKFILKVQRYINTVIKAMKKSRRNYKPCNFQMTIQNLKNLHPGEMFFELEGAIQKFIVHKPDLFKTEMCSKTCEDASDGLVYGCYNTYEWCPHRPCRGLLKNCQKIDSVKICEMGDESVKRYSWVDKNWGMDSYSECNGTIQNVLSWSRFLYVSCDVCMCTCYEHDPDSLSNHTINLRPQLANINENMVITDVRFISMDKMIQIQIKEGKLLPRARIDETHEHWVEPERFLYDQYLYDSGGFYYLHKNGTSIPLESSNNYFYINETHNGLNLDEINVPSGYVITGIKFQYNNAFKTHVWNESPIQIAIHATKFDFYSGTLLTDLNSTIWITANSQPNPSNHYKYTRNFHHVNDIYKHSCSWSKAWKTMSNTMNLMKSENSSFRDDMKIYRDDKEACSQISVWRSAPNSYIQFQSSSFDADAGQSTIPYFNGGYSDSLVSAPLTGINLFYQTVPWWGGVLSFEINHIDYTPYIQTLSIDDLIDIIMQI